jgi:hypothetical protein
LQITLYNILHKYVSKNYKKVLEIIKSREKIATIPNEYTITNFIQVML